LSPPNSTTPAAVPGAAVIRVGITLLAVSAFALSYDALRQTAVAIHIRQPLTYVFPLVIDGFIALGVLALLMLRTAPAPSRVYVWALVGLATLTSIWANALHAVRLNQQVRPGHGLRLSDATVGGLSAVAPLALAGAVHLYLVVRRQTPTGAESTSPTTSKPPNAAPGVASSVAQAAATADVAGRDGDVAPDTPNVAPPPRLTALPPSPAVPGVVAERLAVARTAPTGRHERASRRHIEDAFRSRGLSISRREADLLKDAVQAELDTNARQEPRPGGVTASTS
jgi:hypothetical protein